MRNIEIVELLLDKGARVSAVDKVLFKTHLHITHACTDKSGHKSILRFSVVKFSDVGVFQTVTFQLANYSNQSTLCFFHSERRHTPPHCHPRAKPKVG